MNSSFFPHFEWGWQQARVFPQSLWGAYLYQRVRLFAAAPVARRVSVLTIRILANGKCFFMLRSGKFNNTLAGFMLSSENRMNMERGCDLKSSISASPDVGQSAFNSRPSPVSLPFSRVTGLFLYLFIEGFMLWSLVYPKKQNETFFCMYIIMTLQDRLLKILTMC